MRDEHSLLHIYCIGLDTIEGIEHNTKIKVNKGMHACYCAFDMYEL
jgi:hypothetical protein